MSTGAAALKAGPMREQNDPSRIPKPPPPCGPGVPGKPARPRQPRDISENQPNTGVPVPEERTRDDPIEKAPADRKGDGESVNAWVSS